MDAKEKTVDTWDVQIIRVRTLATYAVRSGEPENSMQLRQLMAQLEWLEYQRVAQGSARWVLAETQKEPSR
jgi:hypothetical protein